MLLVLGEPGPLTAGRVPGSFLWVFCILPPRLSRQHRPAVKSLVGHSPKRHPLAEPERWQNILQCSPAGTGCELSSGPLSSLLGAGELGARELVLCMKGCLHIIATACSIINS